MFGRGGFGARRRDPHAPARDEAQRGVVVLADLDRLLGERDQVVRKRNLPSVRGVTPLHPGGAGFRAEDHEAQVLPPAQEVRRGQLEVDASHLVAGLAGRIAVGEDRADVGLAAEVGLHPGDGEVPAGARPAARPVQLARLHIKEADVEASDLPGQLLPDQQGDLLPCSNPTRREKNGMRSPPSSGGPRRSLGKVEDAGVLEEEPAFQGRTGGSSSG